jgi:predicted  nucleic acid-binding Zn-ribbon protein
LERFSSYLIKNLEAMQAKYQEQRSEKTNTKSEADELQRHRRLFKEITKSIRARSTSPEKMEHEVSSMVTEGLRRYVRERMSAVTRALDEDISSWIRRELREALEAWRLDIVAQLDLQLQELNTEEYKALLLPHKETWRRLALEARLGVE